EHTVFEAEVVGTILALDIAREVKRMRRVVILLDNQAVIRAEPKWRPQPGKYLVSAFHQSLVQVLRQKPHLDMHIAWIPGHMDVPGNEWADEEAKAAAAGSTTQLRHPPAALKATLPVSAAALKAAQK
ncbi:uncharacterized protein SCHCODRAFT_02472331, partial [Schizophyllum commune H4-8]|uniref:uncharacterized protein n=1 Tax=Schizophyllum commune (strain H4-8 / FGSC 9210) TaxID=578458 RepID=UPI002160D861